MQRKPKTDPEVVSEQELPLNPKKKRSGAYSKRVGNNYELKIVKELKEITKDSEIATARSESRTLDNDKIDIFDPNNSIPFYVQCKATQSIPSVKKINEAVGRTDKTLAIFWNAREKKETNCVSQGEYVILKKETLYELLEAWVNKQ